MGEVPGDSVSEVAEQGNQSNRHSSLISQHWRCGGDAGEDFIHALPIHADCALCDGTFEVQSTQKLREAGVAHFSAWDADVDRLSGGLDGNHDVG